VNLVELCAGTASVSLYALGRPGCRPAPLTGYMGSKRRWAADLCRILGVADRQPDRVVLVDAGPWGDVWSSLREPETRRGVAQAFDFWDRRDLVDLWAWLSSTPPTTTDPVFRVAQFLWLQARSAGTIPVWWSADRGRWESPTGSRTEAAHFRGGSPLVAREKGRASRLEGPAYQAEGLERRRATRGGAAAQKGYGCRGIQRPGTIARRIRDLDALAWERLEVVHGDCRSVEPIPDSVVYLDPPYLGCPRYAALLPRSDVLDLARRWAEACARVLVSEAEPLDLPGWTSRWLSGRKPEALTGSWPFTVEQQLGLFAEAA